MKQVGVKLSRTVQKGIIFYVKVAHSLKSPHPSYQIGAAFVRFVGVVWSGTGAERCNSRQLRIALSNNLSIYQVPTSNQCISEPNRVRELIQGSLDA